MNRHLLAVLSGLALALSACGGDDDDDAAGDPCQEAGEKLCDEACACTEGEACAFGYGDTESSFVLSFDTRGDCLFLSIATCSSDEAEDVQVDWDACMEALGSATCFDDSDGTGALLVPAECSEEEDDVTDDDSTAGDDSSAG